MQIYIEKAEQKRRSDNAIRKGEQGQRLSKPPLTSREITPDLFFYLKSMIYEVGGDTHGIRRWDRPINEPEPNLTGDKQLITQVPKASLKQLEQPRKKYPTKIPMRHLKYF